MGHLSDPLCHTFLNLEGKHELGRTFLALHHDDFTRTEGKNKKYDNYSKKASSRSHYNILWRHFSKYLFSFVLSPQCVSCLSSEHVTTIHYIVVLHCEVLYCGTALCLTVLYCTVLHCYAFTWTVLHYTALYCTVQRCNWIFTHFTALLHNRLQKLNCTTLYWTVLHCITFLCNALYCTELYCNEMHCTTQ